MSEWVCAFASELENEWVFYVNQTAHAICRHSFRQSLDSFCFSLSAFRFSLFAFHFFAFRFSIIGLCHVVTVICVHEYLSVLVSELESEWVSVLHQSNSSCHICRRSFGQSQDSFCFSLFAFRFSLTHTLTHSCTQTLNNKSMKQTYYQKTKSERQKESCLWPNERLHMAWAVWWT